MASLYKKPMKVADPATGERKTAKSKKWYGRYCDTDGTEHRVPLIAYDLNDKKQIEAINLLPSPSLNALPCFE